MPPDSPPGATLTLAERDYLFGVGTLRLKVARVLPSRFTHEGDVWAMVEGSEIGWDGVVRHVRRVAVRASVLGRG